MKRAKIYKTIDTNYKNGFILCQCGYKKELGNGFNEYYINHCPKCCDILETRKQSKVIYYDKKLDTLRADIGSNMYFTISNGINMRYTTFNITTLVSTERISNKL